MYTWSFFHELDISWIKPNNHVWKLFSEKKKTFKSIQCQWEALKKSKF